MNMVKDRYITPVYDKVTLIEDYDFTFNFMKPCVHYLVRTKYHPDRIHIHHRAYIDWEKECVIPF